MTCLVCGSKMQTQRENFRYDACGVPGITLIGVEVSRCPQCGEYEVAIPQIEDLHHTIAQALVRKTSPLTAAEIRYLRTSLGWSGADFARHMGTTAETVSRWETGAASMGPVADRLLRLIVATRAPVSDSSLEWLTTITKEKPPHAVRLELTRDDEGWHAEAVDLAAV